jgi:hypothetical protein
MMAAWELAFFHTVLYNELVPFEIESAPGRRFFRNSGRSEPRGCRGDPPVLARPGGLGPG